MSATQTSRSTDTSTCPFLKQVVMLYCDACPMKKMVPLDHLVSGGPCASGYESCPMYQDVVARVGLAVPIDTELPSDDGTGSEKEVSS